MTTRSDVVHKHGAGTKMPDDNVDIERLKAELAQEIQMKEMLNHSMEELQITVSELEKRVNSVDDDNNEWKTRYDTQLTLNAQLEKQIAELKERAAEARKNIRDNRLPSKAKDLEEQEVTAHFVRKLEKDKRMLKNDIRDMEWRLDQESSAYHKLNERRRSVQLKVTSTPSKLGTQSTTPRSQSKASNEPRTPKPKGNVNIQQDQRILEPQKGPIKKTAAVHTLPKIETLTSP